MRHITRLAAVIWALFVLALTANAQTNTWDGSSSTNWGTGANWSLGHVPTASEDVVIPDSVSGLNDNPTVNVAAVCASLTIAAGVQNITLSISGTNSLTVSGAVTINAGSGADKTISVGSGTLSCASITMANTSSSSDDCALTITTGTVTVTGNITMNGAADENAVTFTGAGRLNLGGSISGGDLASATGSTVNYNGSSAQTIAINGDYVYTNLHINNAAGATLQAATTTTNVTGNTRVQSGVLNNGGFAITGGSDDAFELANGATLKLAGTTSGFPSGFGLFSMGTTSSTVDYTGSGNQTVTAISYGHLTLSNGGNKTMPAGNVNIGGNLTVSGSAAMVHNSGTVTFNGSGAQSTTGTTFNNLTINNSGSGVTLNGNETVAGTLTLTNGQLITGSSKVIVTNTAGAAVAFGSGSINGEIQRATATNSTDIYRFTNEHTRITPNAAQGGRTINVKSFPGTNAPSDPGEDAIRRYYTITVTGGALTATLRLAYAQSEVRGGQDENIFTLWRYDPPWVNLLSSTFDATANWVQQIDISTWSDWTISESGSGLPIQMASFSASLVRNRDVEVTWRTVSETNNYGFEIHRKRGNSGEWVKLAFVEGHGTTLVPKSYTYVDHAVSFGKYYYRIKQIDLDGKSETFPEIEVTVGIALDKLILVQNYPNPFNPTTVIEFVVPKGGFASVKVYNLLGQEVATVFEGNTEADKIYTGQFDARNFESGVYFYRLQAGSFVETKKMVLMK